MSTLQDAIERNRARWKRRRQRQARALANGAFILPEHRIPDEVSMEHHTPRPTAEQLKSAGLKPGKL